MRPSTGTIEPSPPILSRSWAAAGPAASKTSGASAGPVAQATVTREPGRSTTIRSTPSPPTRRAAADAGQQLGREAEGALGRAGAAVDLKQAPGLALAGVGGAVEEDPLDVGRERVGE